MSDGVLKIFGKLTATPIATGVATRLGVERLVSLGVDPDPLLARAGLSRLAVVKGERLSVGSQIYFLDLASRAADDEWFGLTLAEGCDLRETGMLYYVSASSDHLGDALKRLSRYVRLGNEALVMRLKKQPGCSVERIHPGKAASPMTLARLP
jgi:hypothetical protein